MDEPRFEHLKLSLAVRMSGHASPRSRWFGTGAVDEAYPDRTAGDVGKTIQLSEAIWRRSRIGAADHARGKEGMRTCIALQYAEGRLLGRHVPPAYIEMPFFPERLSLKPYIESFSIALW
jgi:hypothetical protein